MRPTLKYIKSKFDYYNALCFGGKLPHPKMKLNMRYGQMGVMKYRQYTVPNTTMVYRKFTIEISIRRDLPEEEYTSTLVHEMIHYYIAYNHIVDDSAHGSVFKKMMHDITSTYGIKLSIAFTPSDEYLINNFTHPRYICVAEFENGKMGLAVVAKNRVFQLWDVIPKIQGVSKVRWYLSNRAIFEKYPVSVSPRLFYEDFDKIHHYLTGALELENNGTVITPKSNHNK